MCHRVLDQIPAMTAEERQQLRRNCERAAARSGDGLVLAEARRILDELDAIEQREVMFIAGLDETRRIEYAFRRLPANDQQRLSIQAVHEHGWPVHGWPVHGPAADTDGGEDAESWYRWFAAMCRDRRHLLHPEADDVQSLDRAATELAWAGWLLAFDEQGSVRGLKAEAVSAFARLGYLRQCAA